MSQFTIRDLCWLVLVAALCAAWWAERRESDRQVRLKLDRIVRDYEVLFDNTAAARR